jgi:hypothetical protein
MVENQKGTTARGAAKKTAARKSAAPRVAAKKATARKKATPRAAAKKAGLEKQISLEERFRLIQEAAYLKAEKEGFNCDQSECWLIAEAEVDARLAGSR